MTVLKATEFGRWTPPRAGGIEHPNDMRVGFETFTPDQMGKILERSPNFRKVNRARLAKIKNDIRERGFVQNGNPIIFDLHGNLIDGQHRLIACMELGLTVQFFVVRGVEDETMIDTNKPRSAAELLAFHGFKNTNSLAALARCVWRRDRGALIFNDGTSTAVTPGETLATVRRYPRMIDSLNKTDAIRRKLSNRTAFAFLHFVVSEEDESLVNEFLDGAESGEMLQADDPRLALRRRLLSIGSSPMKKIKTGDRAALIIKAWNHWISGRPCNALVYRRIGPASEPFPEIIMPSKA